MTYEEKAISGRKGIPEAERGTRKDKPVELGQQTHVLLSGGPMPFDSSTETALTPATVVKTVRDFEAFLRQHGFSRTDAKRSAAKGFHPAVDETAQLVDLLRANLERLSE